MRVLGVFGLSAGLTWAAYPEFENVQRLNADPSPTKSESNINEYTYQDEQINIVPSDGVVKVLRTDQKILINDYVTAVIPIKHAEPRELRNVFRQVTALEGGRAEVIRDKETGENFLQVIAPEYMIPYLRDAVAALDDSWVEEYNDGSSDLYLNMQHRDAAEVDFFAANYAGNDGFSTIDTTNNSVRRYDEIYRNEKYAAAATLFDIPCNQVELEIKVYEVNTSNDLKLGLDYINWQNGPGRNLWYFVQSGYSAEQRAFGRTSVFDPFLDARAPIHPGVTDKTLVQDTAARAGLRAVNYLLTSNFIDFLQVKGKARAIDHQTITLCSGSSGSIGTLDQVLAFVDNMNDITDFADENPTYIRRQNNGIGVPDSTPNLLAKTGFGDGLDQFFLDVNGNGIRDFIDENNNGVRDFIDLNNDGIRQENEPFTEPLEDLLGDSPSSVRVQDSTRRLHYENAGTVGMKVCVTPYVGLESMELDIDLDIGEMNGIAPNGTPIINFRSLATTVRLMDGQPFVLAALKQVNDVKSTAKAPFLGSIPVVGYLFGGETDVKRENDVVITITPHFQLSDQVKLYKPPRIDTLQMIIDGTLPQGAPAIDYGYDQWLLDCGHKDHAAANAGADEDMS
ncbi:MAG TPA: hypothetical protein PK847_13420 [Candidatus Sumerlaeota bacterium]|nr:hypothetical protein [Candidatus Sumerlaeota bacterium]HOR29405.1 hypothetical protein [Candidatus Sumerlaeota bacterium]